MKKLYDYYGVEMVFVDKEIIENLCISIRGYLKELMDAQDIE